MKQPFDKLHRLWKLTLQTISSSVIVVKRNARLNGGNAKQTAVGFSGEEETTVDVHTEQEIHPALGVKTRRLSGKEAV
jgi:hypothetical protein